MKKYCVGPKKIYRNGDAGCEDTAEYNCDFIIAETPAKAKKLYIQKTGCAMQLYAEFICLAL